MTTPYQTPESHLNDTSSPVVKKQLKSVAPLRAGIVLGVLYAIMVFLVLLIIAPIGILSTLAGASSAGGEAAAIGMGMGVGMGIGMLIFAPIIYGVLGFIFGALSAWIYNMIAKMTGGFIFSVEDL